MKKSILILVLCVLVVTGCSSKGTQDSPIADGTFTVGMECDYAPYNWTTNEANKSSDAVKISGFNGYCDGYDVMIAQKIADYLGVELEIKKIAWDGLIPAVKSGEIDAIIAGMSPTEERKNIISFSDDYFKDNPEQAILVLKDSSFANATSINDFEKARITAQMGTLQVRLLEQLPGIVSVPEYADYASLMKALSSNSVDGYIAELAVAQEHAAANSNFKVIRFAEGDGFVLSEGDTTTAIGVKKGNDDFITQLNEALASISQETRQELMDLASSRVGDE